MYSSIDEDDDLLAALCFNQSNGVGDPYGYIQTDQDNIFSNFGSFGVNLQLEQDQIGAQFDLRSYDGIGISSSFGLGQNNDSGPNVQQETEQVCNGVVEINSSSSGTVKEEVDHVDEECSRKRGRTGSSSKPGTKACREKLRREKLNDRFMDLSSVLEPGRTPKTDKSVILEDAIRVVNKLRDEANELKETNHKLLEEIKSLKAEKNELREEKLVLKTDKEKMEQQLKSMASPSPGYMPAFHPNKMAMYPSYGYYPNMQMWTYLHPKECDTSHDHLKRPPAA